MQIDVVIIHEVRFNGRDFLRFNEDVWYYVSEASGDLVLLSEQACTELEDEYLKNTS